MPSTEKVEYYVFEMSKKDRRQPLRQVNKEPLTLDKAKKLARIGAQKGTHDRAVTTSPTSRSFRIVAQYSAGAGKDVAIMYRRGSGVGKRARSGASRKKNPDVARVETVSVTTATVEHVPEPYEAPEPDAEPQGAADEV